MRVDIFVLTTFSRPSKSSGKVLYIIRINGNGQDKTITRTYSLADSTPDMADRRTLIVALRHLVAKGEETIHKDYEPHIYLYRPTVKTAVTQWSMGWIKNDWKTAKRGPVRYRDEWKRLLTLLGDRPVEFHVGEHHEFYSWMKGELERCLKNLENSTATKR